MGPRTSSHLFGVRGPCYWKACPAWTLAVPLSKTSPWQVSLVLHIPREVIEVLSVVHWWNNGITSGAVVLNFVDICPTISECVQLYRVKDVELDNVASRYLLAMYCVCESWKTMATTVNYKWYMEFRENIVQISLLHFMSLLKVATKD